MIIRYDATTLKSFFTLVKRYIFLITNGPMLVGRQCALIILLTSVLTLVLIPLSTVDETIFWSTIWTTWILNEAARCSLAILRRKEITVFDFCVCNVYWRKFTLYTYSSKALMCFFAKARPAFVRCAAAREQRCLFVLHSCWNIL